MGSNDYDLRELDVKLADFDLFYEDVLSRLDVLLGEARARDRKEVYGELKNALIALRDPMRNYYVESEEYNDQFYALVNGFYALSSHLVGEASTLGPQVGPLLATSTVNIIRYFWEEIDDRETLA